jgi:hypothetical protein
MQTAALPPIIVRWVKRLSEEYYGALVLIVRKAARIGTSGLVLAARVGRLWSLSHNFQTVLPRASVNKGKNRRPGR